MTHGDDLLRLVVEQVQKTEPAAQPSDLGSLFRGSATLSGAEQLEIYREQFWLRHTHALEEDFPGLSRLMGSLWPPFVTEYLVQNPATSFTLRDLGARLPAFIRSKMPDSAHYGEMADLEWAYMEAFDATMTSPLSERDLQTLTEDQWQSAKVLLNPSLRLLQLDYPVHEIRRALRRGDETRVSKNPTHLLVYRHKDLSVYDKVIHPLAFELLQLLKNGTSLGHACDKLAQDPTKLAVLEQDLGAWFRNFGELGLVSGVTQ
jgi:hypothetical protein